MKTFSKAPGSETLAPVACSLCGGNESRRLFGSDSLWVKCRKCGLVYQNPQPKVTELLKRYDAEYFRYEIENEDRFFALMELGLKDIRFEELDMPTVLTPVFLDVGCATGRLLAWARDEGWKEKGIEVCRAAAEYGRQTRGVDIYSGTIEEAGLESDTVDVVHCSHLIEHLNNPVQFVKEVVRILKPGGYFIVTTPNIAGLQSWLFRAGWRSMIPDHLYLFSVATLRQLLELSGLTVLRHKTWGGLGAGSAPSWLKRPVDQTAKKWGVGDVVIMLAQKHEVRG